MQCTDCNCYEILQTVVCTILKFKLSKVSKICQPAATWNLPTDWTAKSQDMRNKFCLVWVRLRKSIQAKKFRVTLQKVAKLSIFVKLVLVPKRLGKVKTRSRGVEVIDLSRPTFNQKPFRTELTAHLVIEVYEVRRLDAILTNMRGNKTRTLN